MKSLIQLICVFCFTLSANALMAQCGTCPVGQADIQVRIWGDQYVDTEGTLSATIGGTAVTITNLRTGATGTSVAFESSNVTGASEWWVFSLGCQPDGQAIVVTYTDSFNDGTTASIAGEDIWIYSDGLSIAAGDIPSTCGSGCDISGVNTTNFCPYITADPTQATLTGVTTANWPLTNDSEATYGLCEPWPTSSVLLADGGGVDMLNMDMAYGPMTQCAPFVATANRMDLFVGGGGIAQPNTSGCSFAGLEMTLYDETGTTLLVTGTGTTTTVSGLVPGTTYIMCASLNYVVAPSNTEFCTVDYVSMGVAPNPEGYWVGGTDVSAGTGTNYTTCDQGSIVIEDTDGCLTGPNGPCGTIGNNEVPVVSICPSTGGTLNFWAYFDGENDGGTDCYDFMEIFDGESRNDDDIIATVGGCPTNVTYWEGSTTGSCVSVFISTDGTAEQSAWSFCWETVGTIPAPITYAAGDDCDSPQFVDASVLPYTYNASSYSATSGPIYNNGVVSGSCEPDLVGDGCTVTIENTQYVAFSACDVAPSDITIDLLNDVCDANGNPPQFFIYEVTNMTDPCNNLAFVNCTGSGASGGTNTLTFSPTAGATYVVVTDGFRGDHCTFDIRFDGGLCETVFPVEYLYIQGRAFDRYNRIKWATASENNNSHFVIERSFDGVRFQEIGKVDGNGTTSEPSYYEFIDNNPSKVNYYRVRQIDFDGTEDVSNVISIASKTKGLNIVKISPNPTVATTTMIYNLDRRSDIEVTVSDVLGKALYTRNVDGRRGENQVQLDLSNYANGIYFVTMSNRQEMVVQKIVKN